MPKTLPVHRRSVRVGLALGTALALASCLGELASPRGTVGEAAIDLRGLRPMSQVANDTSDEVQSAMFRIFALTGTTRREVASRLFTAKDFDQQGSDDNTVFTVSFPYTSADDKFELVGYGFSAQGDTLYRVGPASFTMTSATRVGSQTVVSVVVPPDYVGPGRTATKLTISPRPVTTEEGKTTAVSAVLTDATGKGLTSPTFRIRWYSMDGSVAMVLDERIGQVTGGARAGAARLVAVFEPMSLSDTVNVINTVRPAQLTVVEGSNQTGRAGTVLSLPISVQARSANGEPVPGVSLTFTVTQGGGTMASAAGQVTTSVRSTGNNGVATAGWTLGSSVGTQQLSVSAAGVPTITVTATATAAAPSASQSSVSVLPTAIQTGGEEATVTVTLRDDGGNPVPNTAVTFSGSSTAIFAGTSATTNASGGRHNPGPRLGGRHAFHRGHREWADVRQRDSPGREPLGDPGLHRGSVG